MSSQQHLTPGQQPSPDQKRRRRKIFEIVAAVAGSSAAVYIINAIASGIIGNLASDLLNRFIAWLRDVINTNVLLEILVIEFIAIIAIYLLMRHRDLQAKSQIQNMQDEFSQERAAHQAARDELACKQDELQINQNNFKKVEDRLIEKDQESKVDDLLLNDLASGWISSGNVDKNTLQKVLSRMLYQATETPVFKGDVHRAAIFIPDDDEYLRMKVHYQMPADSVSRTVGYIGKDKNKEDERGAVGEAYHAPQLTVAHFNDESDTKSYDCPAYKNFDKERTRLPYRSLILVPIVASTNDSIGNTQFCYGMLCLDSKNPTIFDSPEAQRFLIHVSERLAIVLRIYQLVSQPNSTPVLP